MFSLATNVGPNIKVFVKLNNQTVIAKSNPQNNLVTVQFTLFL